MTRPTIHQLNDAVAAENERCAQLCEAARPNCEHFSDREWAAYRALTDMADAIRSSAKQSIESKAARLSQVTDEAIAMFNSSRLVKQNGGLLASVHPTVGRANRQSQVKRCVKVARDICRVSFESEIITPEFWEQFFAICHGDDFLAGRGPRSPGHEGWTSNFEYLTRPATMLKVFEKSEAV